nr:TlpA disulfide reductase family protein [Parabacteroides sp. AF17-3]
MFSASWCQPCHKQLPVQKEIYQKLKDKVDFVTISIDEKKTIKQWQEFVKKEELPWRSLLAYQDIAGVRGKYYVPHIPHILLVYPDGNFEPFNLWEENEINKLYALTGN